jgi:hypothetical protein
LKTPEEEYYYYRDYDADVDGGGGGHPHYQHHHDPGTFSAVSSVRYADVGDKCYTAFIWNTILLLLLLFVVKIYIFQLKKGEQERF